MQFKEITSQDIWDDFVQSHNGSFLQSWNWGQFNAKQGHAICYLGMFEKEELVGVSLLAVITARRGAYVECIGGPLFVPSAMEEYPVYFGYWHEYAIAYAKEYHATHVRVRVPFEESKRPLFWLDQFGYRKTHLYYQAEITEVLGITLSEDELLAAMSKQTRYDIRRAERDGVTIEVITRKDWEHLDESFEKYFDTFWQLYSKMVERQGYVGYTRRYLFSQFALFFKDDQAKLYLASYQGVYVAGAIVFRFGHTATYHHAASVPMAKLSPAALVLWQAIVDAKAAGCTVFDLFGGLPPGKKYASRAGLVAFKKGFGSSGFVWTRTHDFVLRPLPYYLALAIEMIPLGIRLQGRDILMWLRSKMISQR